MSIGDCLRGVCRFVSEFMRLILFVTCIIFMLVSVSMFIKSLQAIYTYKTIELSGAQSCFIVILFFAIYLIALSVLGIHATFFRDGTSIEWFSLLAAMNVLIGLAVFMYASLRTNESSMEIHDKLKDLQPKYNWTTEPASVGYNNIRERLDATRKWNFIQRSNQCCGVQSPADWGPFRPEDSMGALPSSCCFALDERDRCLEANAWAIGCVSQIRATNAKVSLQLSSLIFMNLLLSLVGNLVICCQLKPGYLVF